MTTDIEPFRFQPASQYEPPAQQWLVANLFLAGTLNLLLGKAKAGKSRLTAGIVAALTTGVNVGGCSNLTVHQPHRVLWIGSDGGWKRQAKAALCENNPMALDQVYFPTGSMADMGLTYSTSTHVAETSETWLKMAEQARLDGVDVLIVDHLLGALGDRGINEDVSVAPFLTTLTRIGEMGITPIVLHHISEKQFGNMEGSAMGHTLITASARQILSLRPKTGGKEHQEVFIRGNETPEMAMLVKPLGAGPLTITWLGEADKRPGKRSTTDNNPQARQKANRGDKGPKRAQFILDGPPIARVNQTQAGQYLEKAPKDIKGDVTNGREAVKALIQKGLLAHDDTGQIIQGTKLAEQE